MALIAGAAPLSTAVFAGPTSTVPATPALSRAIVFIQGIDSESRPGQSPTDCGPALGFLDGDGAFHAGWIVDYLSDPDHVGGLALQEDENFFYFSYSGQYCLENGVEDFRRPIYSAGDTCDGVGEAADRLQTLLAALISQNPETRFDLVAHSMGGLVATYWLTQHGDDQTAEGLMKDFVNSITTFDSPLRGIPAPNPTSACCPWDQSWTDMMCTPHCSQVVDDIQEAGAEANLFTLDATQTDLAD